jgi:hypothetical protein
VPGGGGQGAGRSGAAGRPGVLPAAAEIAESGADPNAPEVRGRRRGAVTEGESDGR